MVGLAVAAPTAVSGLEPALCRTTRVLQRRLRRVRGRGPRGSAGGHHLPTPAGRLLAEERARRHCRRHG